MAEGRDEGPGITTDEIYQRLLLTGFRCRWISRYSSALCKWTIVGSAGSGTTITGSDVDMMMERPDLIIDESMLDYRNDLPCYVRIPTSGLPVITPDILLDGGDYMRADRLRDHCERLFDTILAIDGESKVGKTFLGSENKHPIDFIPQIRIDGMPRPARLFITRYRSWPSDDIISLVSTGEFHLAARPAPCIPDKTHDFCLSFAKAEVVLTRSMSTNQVLCTKYLKTVRPLINVDSGVLTSYHVKTTSLWYWEETDNNTRLNDPSVTGILEKLDKYLAKVFLPHYFVPDMNLFAGISQTHLIEIRRRIHSFLGLSLIVHDVTEISSHTKLLLTMDMMNRVNPRPLELHVLQSSGMVAGDSVSDDTVTDDTGSDDMGDDDTGTDAVVADINIHLQSAEALYLETKSKRNSSIYADVGITRTKTKLFWSMLSLVPLHVIKAEYVKEIEKKQATLNKIADKRVRFRQMPDNKYCEMITDWMRCVADAFDEPLESAFRMGSVKTDHDVGRHDRTVSQQRKQIMKNWMKITDNIITKLNSNMNYVVGEFLGGLSRGSSFSDVSTRDIDSLLCNGHVTSELLSSALRAIEELSPDTDSCTDSLTLTSDSDARANIEVLVEAMERLFIPVEYAIVRNIRPDLAGVPRDHGVRLTRCLKPASLEYKCMAAYLMTYAFTHEYANVYFDLHRLHGWMEFMAATIRSGRDT